MSDSTDALVGCYPNVRSPKNVIVHAIVQARMGSERFPGKMLADLAGKPVLGHVIDRLKKCKTLHNVIVASPDKELVDFAYANGAWGYPDTGDPNNVLLRYIKASGWAGSQLVVRITGDCPLIHPDLVDTLVSEYLQSRADLVTNVQRRSFPKGLDIEVLHPNTLKRIYHLTQDARYLEHVTLFCYENPALFVVKNINNKGRDYSFINLSIDTPKDLDKVKELMSTLSKDSTIDDMVNNWEMLF